MAENGPTSSGTVAEYNKFHDDKSMYTGAYAANVGLDAKVRSGMWDARFGGCVHQLRDTFCVHFLYPSGLTFVFF